MAKILNFDEYQQLAFRTAKPLPKPDQQEHALMGIVTELGEIVDIVKKVTIYGKPFDDALRTNFIEEVGDFMWYVALYLTNRDTSWTPMGNVSLGSDPDVRDVWYDCCKPVIEKLGRALGSDDHSPEIRAIAGYVKLAAESLNLDFYSILGINIAKLAKRYGDKYSDQAALVRDLTAEYEVLKQAA